LGPYLPATPPGSPYSEGGSLYALGLVHANHGGDTTQFLVDQLDSVSNPILQHGACLGIGLAAMATGDKGLYA
jgi:26S proteasome regulatory subunit N2